ncbi:MAG: 3D domain-containing protein [Spirochaetes bacterium]|nr:3D domain-containing protein [Spirochaetota bacterium]
MKGLRLFNKLYMFGFILLFMITILFAGLSINSNPSRIFYNDEILNSGLFKNCTELTLKCRVTAYCPGPCCNSEVVREHGKSKINNWSDRVAAGGLSISRLHDAGIDIAAVDTRIIPLGSIIDFNGRSYIALDSGKAIKGRRIDLSMRTHETADDFGMKYGQRITVYIPENPPAVVRRIKEVAGDTVSGTGGENNDY